MKKVQTNYNFSNAKNYLVKHKIPEIPSNKIQANVGVNVKKNVNQKNDKKPITRKVFSTLNDTNYKKLNILTDKYKLSNPIVIIF